MAISCKLISRPCQHLCSYRQYAELVEEVELKQAPVLNFSKLSSIDFAQLSTPYLRPPPSFPAFDMINAAQKEMYQMTISMRHKALKCSWILQHLKVSV